MNWIWRALASLCFASGFWIIWYAHSVYQRVNEPIVVLAAGYVLFPALVFFLGVLALQMSRTK